MAAFKEKKFADEMIERLKAKGYPAYGITATSSENITFYKVRVGAFEDMAEAETMLKKMQQENLKAIIVVDPTADE